MSNYSVLSINSDTTIDYNFNLFFVDASANNVTITLPIIYSNGNNLIIKRIDTNINFTVSVIGQFGALIDNETTKILNTNTTTIFNSYDNNWYTINTQRAGSEIVMSFNQLVGTNNSRPYILINKPAYTAVIVFTYYGQKYYGSNLVCFEISYSIDTEGTSSSTFEIHLQDITNKNIIAVIGPITQVGNMLTYETVTTNVFTNVPDTIAQFEIDAKISPGTSAIRLRSFKLILN